MFERVLLLFTQRENYPPASYVRRVPAAVTHAYTAVQVACFVQLWVVKSNFFLNPFLPSSGESGGGGGGGFPAGLLFPVVLAMTIPFKVYVLPLVFCRPVLDVVAGGSSSSGGDADADVQLFY